MRPTGPIAILLHALLASGVALAQQVPPPRTVMPADIMSLRDVHEPQLSPDGHDILFTVVAHPPGGRPDESTLWTVAAGGDTPARPFGPGLHGSGGRYSPDGRRIAFLADIPGPAAAGADAPKPGVAPPTAIWIVAASGGAPHRLTGLPDQIRALRWSPDGRRIAFVATPPDSAAQKQRDALKQDWSVSGEAGPRDALWVVDSEGGTPRRLTDGRIDIADFDWLGDDGGFVARVPDTPRIDDFFYHSRVVLLDRAGAVLRTLEPQAAASPVRASPDGGRIVCARLGAGGISTTAEIVDVRSGTVLPVGADGPTLIWDMQWDPDGHGLLGEGFVHTAVAFFHVDAATGAMRDVAHGVAAAPDFSRSRDGRTTAWVGQSATRPNDVRVLGAGGDRARTDINPQVATWRLGTVREISWHSHLDGRLVYGVLVLPPGHRDGMPLKTIVQIHGGPEWAWWSGWLGSWHEWAQMLASHGYAVFLPNPRGSEGQGVAFARAALHDFGGADYQDILDGLDMLVSRHVADPARLGIGGWSYGGFMSAWAVGHTDRFRAAVVGAGMINLFTMSLTSDTPDYLPGYLGDPLASRDLYLDRSPETFLTRIRTPVLVLHGEADTRVPIAQGEEIDTALRRAGRPVEMVRYPREPHWFHEREHQQDVLARVLAWFDGHV